jgi:pimeloyl-ACP methyl ester carboxylesterase
MTSRLLERHRASGQVFTAGGIGSFVLDEGPRDGEAVVCVHGVPASAYLYRKVVPALATRGLRGIAVDLPGLGLAERPADADYSWTDLGRWLGSAIDALELDRFHLVVHDIGGPIGLEVAAADPHRVRSLTILNTTIAVESFHRPWVMEPFAHPIAGEAWLSCVRLPARPTLSHWVSIWYQVRFAPATGSLRGQHQHKAHRRQPMHTTMGFATLRTRYTRVRGRTKRRTQSRITAPRIAVNSVNHQPPLAVSTKKLSRKPPIRAPTIPTTMSTRTPILVFMIMPAIQPAIAPIMM